MRVVYVLLFAFVLLLLLSWEDHHTSHITHHTQTTEDFWKFKTRTKNSGLRTRTWCRYLVLFMREDIIINNNNNNNNNKIIITPFSQKEWILIYNNVDTIFNKKNLLLWTYKPQKQSNLWLFCLHFLPTTLSLFVTKSWLPFCFFF